MGHGKRSKIESDRIAEAAARAWSAQYEQTRSAYGWDANKSAGASVLAKAARIPSPEEMIITNMMASHDPAIREQGWALSQTPVAVTKAATAEAPAVLALSDTEFARLALSPDPARREVAWGQLTEMLPAADSLLTMLESGDPEDREVALAIGRTGWQAVNKIAGGF